MRAIAGAAAAIVGDPFKPAKLPVRRAEAGRRYQRGEICHGRFLHRGRQRGLSHGREKTLHPRLQGGQVLASVFGRGPGIGEALAVVVADDGIRIHAGRISVQFLPSESGGAIRKVPGEKKRELRFCAGRDGALEADRSDIVPFGGLGPELTVTGEIVPEQQRACPPLRARPAAQVCHPAVSGTGNAQREGTGQRSVVGGAGIGHQKPCKVAGLPIFAGALLRDAGPLLSADPHADRIVERERDGDLYRLAGGIRHHIAQNGHGQTGGVGVQRNDGREGFERYQHRQVPIFEGDLGEWVLTGEGRALEARQPGDPVRTQAAPGFVWWNEPRLQHTRDGLGRADTGADRRERVRRGSSLVGVIEDLPVSQLTAPAKADAAGADSAQGKRDHGELTTGELSRVREAGNRLSRAGGLQRGPASLSFHARSRTRTRARGQRGGLQEVATPYHKIYFILLGCLWML